MYWWNKKLKYCSDCGISICILEILGISREFSGLLGSKLELLLSVEGLDGVRGLDWL
jgi:hypothetical protein